MKRTWAARHRHRDPQRIRAWNFRILTNVYLSDCRRRAARSHAQDQPAEEEPAYSLFGKLHQPFLLWWSNPEKEFLNKLLREDIDRAVDALPEAYRLVVVLSELEGFSYQEIAAILKVPVGTVRSRLARGRSLLQKALWEHAQEAGLVRSPRASAP